VSRQLTWEQECKPQLYIHDTRGDIAVALLWNLQSSVVPSVLNAFNGSNGRLGIIGNVRSRRGISWFLRGLLLNPQIRRVFLWGADLSQTGRALTALWRKGVDQEHKIADYEWPVDQAIQPAHLFTLSHYVTLENLIDMPSTTLATTLSHMAQGDPSPPWGSPIELPPMELPDIERLPSRGVAEIVHASDVGEAWLQALNVVTSLGEVRRTRKKEGIVHCFDFIAEFPCPTTTEVPVCFDLTEADFENYWKHFISEAKSEGVDYGYGERLQNWRGRNQLKEVVARLQKSPDTKRATISLLDAVDLETLEDAPCLVIVTFSISDGRLHMSVIYRSHDMFEGWPLNTLALVRLQQQVAALVGVPIGHTTIHSQNAQVYERQLPDAKAKVDKYLLRKKGVSVDPAGNFVFTILSPEDGPRRVKTQLVSPEGDRVVWETESLNPELMIRDIVYKMPWLEAQHVLYLGQEAEKLSRAIRGHEEYRQG
jgi:thymidylate synthase